MWLNSWHASPDGRRVHDREQLLQVLGEHPVEERGVAVLQRRQADVLLEGVVLAPQALELERDLLLDGHHAVGQQAAKLEGLALIGAEGEVLGEEPIGQQGRAVERNPRRAPGDDGVVGRWQRAHRVRAYASGRGRIDSERDQVRVERETGIEPATCSLEGCRSAN